MPMPGDHRARTAAALTIGVPTVGVRVAAERRDAEPVGAHIRGGRLQRAAAGVAEQPLQRMPPPRRRRAGGGQHRRGDLGRGVPGQQLRPPHPAVGLGVAGSCVDPAGGLPDHQPAAATAASARPTRARTAGRWPGRAR